MVEQGSWHSPRQQQSWGGPGASGAAPAYGPPPSAAPPRGRPGLAALVAVLTEVVVIAAAVNQAVAKHLDNFGFDHGTSFAGLSARSFLVYRWRFSPARGDNQAGFHEWYRELVALGLLLVLTALLVALFVQGAVTFWKAFFGTWFTVVVATCVGTAVASLVTRSLAPPGFTKGTAAVFYVVNSLTLFAAAVLGLVVALITALIATVTRRDAALPAASAPAAAEGGYVPPDAPPPYYGDTGSAPVGAQQAHREPQWRSRPDPRAEAATTALPAVPPAEASRTGSAPAEPEHTQALPQPTEALPAGDQSTSAYQLPPEDDRR